MSDSNSDVGRSGPWVGHPIFSWAGFGLVISYIKFLALLRPYGLMEHKSVNDIAMCISLYTSVTVRKHLIYREHFLNTMGNDKYLVNFGTPNILDIFG